MKKLLKKSLVIGVLFTLIIGIAGCDEMESFPTSDASSQTVANDNNIENISTKETDTKQTTKKETKKTKKKTKNKEKTDKHEKKVNNKPKSKKKKTKKTDNITEQAENLYNTTYPVFVVFNYEKNLIFGRNKKLTVYIDDEKIVKLKQGDSAIYGIILSKGTHTLKISSSIFDTDSIEFDVGEDRLLGNELPNIFTFDLRFKSGDATIYDVMGTNITPYNSIYELLDDYGNSYMTLFYSHKPIGDFETIFKKYYELHPENSLENLESTDNNIDISYDYVCPNSDSKKLKYSDIEDFDADMCRIARNEIYARHGRIFDSQDLNEYFNDKDWYTPLYTADEFDESVLNKYEKYNRDLIVQYESDMGYR